MRRDPCAYLNIYLLELVGGNRFVFTFDAMLFTDILDNSPKLPLAGVVEVALGDGFQTLPSPGLYVGLIEGIDPAKVKVERVSYVAVPLACKRIGDERYYSIGPPAGFDENKLPAHEIVQREMPDDPASAITLHVDQIE